MSIVHRCDRCGGEFDYLGRASTVSIGPHHGEACVNCRVVLETTFFGEARTRLPRSAPESWLDRLLRVLRYVFDMA